MPKRYRDGHHPAIYFFIEATVAVTEVTCGQGGASLTITASGGTSPYQYSIDGGSFQAEAEFKNVQPGDHKFVVRDAAGCQQEGTVTIRNAASTLAATATVTDAVCNEKGTVTVQATGGTPDYSFSIDGGAYQTSALFGNLAAGTHKVTVKDQAGCTAELAIEVKQTENKPNL
jgi:VCBS repeat-containing protein